MTMILIINFIKYKGKLACYVKHRKRGEIMESVKSSTCNKEHSCNDDDIYKNENVYIFIDRHNYFFHTYKN